MLGGRKWDLEELLQSSVGGNPILEFIFKKLAKNPPTKLQAGKKNFLKNDHPGRKLYLVSQMESE